MPKENIEKQSIKHLNPLIKEDLITLGRLFLEKGNSVIANDYFDRAGLTKEDIVAIEQELLSEQKEKIEKETIH